MTYTRAERLQQIHLLMGAGFNHRETAAQLGISLSHVREMLYDPDRSKTLKRRERYRGTCETCGAKTDGSDGYGKAPTICGNCQRQKQHDERYWTQERIIEAVHRFAKEHGRRPVATEWLQGKHGQTGDGYPYATTVLREFGSWANAIEAAGYERPVKSQYFRVSRHLPKGPRVPTQHYIDLIHDTAEDGIALAAQSKELRGAYYMLNRRGIRWAEACEMAGVQPRMTRGWRKRLLNG